MKKYLKAFSYANVMATVAVFLTLGGAAYAVSLAPKNSVTGRSIRDNAVTTKDVRNSSLQGIDVRDDSLTGADVDESTLEGVTLRGPAGGDLTGQFPSPLLGPNTVATEEIANDGVTNTDIAEGAVTGVKLGFSSVDSSKIQDDSVGSPELADAAVGSSEIGDAAVGVSELANDTVGAGAFKGMNTFVSEGVTVTAGTPKSTSVSCPTGWQIVSGGYAWLDDEANSIIGSSPSDTAPNSTWDVRGMVDAGSNRLFAWALCIQP